MDNNQQPASPVQQTQPVMPAQPVAPQPTVAPAPTPIQPQQRSPLMYVGLLLILIAIGAVSYYVMQQRSLMMTTPTPAPVAKVTQPTLAPSPTISEDQQINTAVDYSIDDSFTDIQKDVNNL